MLQYIKHIIIPYVVNVQESLGSDGAAFILTRVKKIFM